MNETRIYDFTVTTIDGRPMSMREYEGKVLLIVNVASKCGFTQQYAGLEDLFVRFRDAGFAVLGFPCNQFGGQEPGSDAEIHTFCTVQQRVTFPMFAKIEVNGANAHPLFEFLRSQQKGILGTTAIKWNFTKFLVDRRGQVVRRFAPQDEPKQIAGDVERLLG